jgi:hypothetical protein
VWINLGWFENRFPSPICSLCSGPLLWHWENNITNDVSIELDLEQAKQLAKEIGFNLSVRL